MPKPIVLDPRILTDLKAQHDALYTLRWSLDDLLGQVFCSRAEDFLSTIPDSSVDMILTDEPYGIGGSSIIAFRDGTRKPYGVIMDFDAELPTHLLNPWVLEAYRILKDGGVLVNCGIESWSTSFENICGWAGLEIKKNGVWIKTNPPTRVRPGGFKSAHERIWVASKGSLRTRMKRVRQAELNNWMIEATCPVCDTQFPVTWSHQYKLTDAEWAHELYEQDDVFVAPYKAHTDRVGHPNEKPDWLASWYINLFTEPNDIVVDPYVGSGWSVVNATRMNRQFIANDYDEKWVRVTRERLSSLQTNIF